MLIARNPRRLRAKRRARCKAQVLAKLDALILRRAPASSPAVPAAR